jgi:Predicted membrane protein (DUF2207)
MGALLAQAVTYPELSGPLLVATVAATALWFVLLLGCAFATWPRNADPAPATMELGDEPPAVVDLLTNEWRVTPDAIPATLLDLAARGYVDLDQYGPQRTVCRIRRTDTGGLQPYERMVLEHVAGLAVDGIVPADALTTGPQDQSSKWWGRFQRHVVEDARDRGLTRDRWSRPVTLLLQLAVLVPAGLGVALANVAIGLGIGTIVAGIVIWLALTSTIKRFRDQRETPVGAEAAARWLGVRDYLGRNEVFPTLPPSSVAIWDRYLGYGAALGVATAALWALPMGAEDDHRAWSSYGGRWRVVRVRYPRLELVWGRSPLPAFLIGLLVAAAGYGALRVFLSLLAWAGDFPSTDRAASWVHLATTILVVTAFLVAVWGLWTIVRALLDLGSRWELEGRVVRMRAYSRGQDHTDHFIAVDDGVAAKVKAWKVPYETYERFREGAVAKATVGRRLGHVFQIELVQPSRLEGPEPAPPVAAAAPAAAGPDSSTAGAGAGGADPARRAWTAGLVGVLDEQGTTVDPAKVVTAEAASSALGEPVGRPGSCSSSRCRWGGCAAASTSPPATPTLRCRCSPPAGR